MNHCGNENRMNKLELLQIVEKHIVRQIINLIVLYTYVHFDCIFGRWQLLEENKSSDEKHLLYFVMSVSDINVC